MKPPLPSLLLITDSNICADLPAAVAAALEGGVTHVLLREKNMAAGPLILLARKLLSLTTSMGAYLLIHGRVDIALAVQAAGVHLPESGMATAQARQLLDASVPHTCISSCQEQRPASKKTDHGQFMQKLLGRSCHSVAVACQALQEGADFVTISPLFASRSHPQVLPLGLQRFAAMRAAIPGPVLALGGINQDNATDAMHTGANGVALIRGILGTANPRQAAAAMLSQIGSGQIDPGQIGFGAFYTGSIDSQV